MEYWVHRNCFLSSPIFWKAHILRLQFSSLVFINQRKFETKLFFLSFFLLQISLWKTKFFHVWWSLLFTMQNETLWNLYNLLKYRLYILFILLKFRLYILLNTSCEIVLFPGAKGNIMESLYINGVHWQKMEDIKASTMVIKTMAWENVLHCFYKPW